METMMGADMVSTSRSTGMVPRMFPWSRVPLMALPSPQMS